MKIHDVSYVPQLEKALRYIESHYIEVGISSKEKGDILMKAHVNEFGFQIEVTDSMRGYLSANGLHLKASTKHINIPERSFIRAGYDTHRKRIGQLGDDMLEQVISGRLSPEAMYDSIGQECVTLIQDYMTELRTPKNHPFTIQEKNSSNPLIHTGELRSKITYEVKRNAV